MLVWLVAVTCALGAAPPVESFTDPEIPLVDAVWPMSAMAVPRSVNARIDRDKDVAGITLPFVPVQNSFWETYSYRPNTPSKPVTD